jgi:PAT family acetyl-CoA transporter-like MFS transporter 1
MLLYILQGVTLGLAGVVPLYLTSFGATWKQLSILSLIGYPFTVKLLWAPLVDVFYIRWLGRRRTWLLPVQIMLGVTFIILSFHLEFLLVQLRVTVLTVVFFFVIFLTATQDICVDGWALTLFSSSDSIWQSISQMIGQPLGGFLGGPVLLTFESANMTNRLIRQPLGIDTRPYGLFTLAQFLRFWGILFLVIACAITLLFREQQQNTNTNKKENKDEHLNLLETYLYIVKLFKKKCFRQLLPILIGPYVGDAATSAMTFVTLIR